MPMPPAANFARMLSCALVNRMQVSMTAHQTADQVQQKGKRIGENVRHQVQLNTIRSLCLVLQYLLH